MGYGYIKFDVKGLDEWIRDLSAVAAPPSFKVIGALSTVLEDAYQNSQVLVHSPENPGSPMYVPTGSLKSSGYVDSTFDGDEWTGTVGYGGPSAGPNNPVDYAIYEQARDGKHDMLRDMPDYAPLFLQAVMEHFKGML